MKKMNLIGMTLLVAIAISVSACGKKASPEYNPAKVEQPKKKSAS